MSNPYEASRPYYQAELADGVERFLEPRRNTCPWCGSEDLSVRLRTGDLIQRKPGRFTLEQCGACGHIFQNPRLTPAGLDFYYRDFYDGLGHLVETRTPAPGGKDVVRHSFFDASGRLVTQSVPYLVVAYTGPSGSAAFSVPACC